jgi:hypothetical protein
MFSELQRRDPRTRCVGFRIACTFLAEQNRCKLNLELSSFCQALELYQLEWTHLDGVGVLIISPTRELVCNIQFWVQPMSFLLIGVNYFSNSFVRPFKHLKCYAKSAGSTRCGSGMKFVFDDDGTVSWSVSDHLT